MSTVEDSPCPKCKFYGTLSLDTAFQTGSFLTQSLAGVQLKMAAFRVPRLRCSHCDLDILGRYDDDGAHVLFPRL